MYGLINDIERYPQFVPWCTAARIESRSEREVVATLNIKRGPLRAEFTTRNLLEPDSRVLMQFVSGPFRVLEGLWTLTALGELGCRVELGNAIRVRQPPHRGAVRITVRRHCCVAGRCFREARARHPGS